MMTILQNAFANTSTSLISQKINESIVDTLMPPLSPLELTIGFILGGATRGLMVAIGVGISLSLVVPISFQNPGAIVFFAFGAALMMGSMGMMTGIWAEKFDHVSTITNFIILPLSFLSGTFFPISRFPELLQIVSSYNPFFYLIDGFRFGFTNQSAGSVEIGIIFIITFNIILWLICYWMLRTGYKIKD
jgi:ABC-2 type transport system permease protein